jgi:hypothetical protein
MIGLIKASNSFIIRLTPQKGWFKIKFVEILKAAFLVFETNSFCPEVNVPDDIPI